MLDFELLNSYSDYLGGNVVLSPEQRSMIRSSLVITKYQMHFSRLLFWGQIRGVQSDYFIVQGVGNNTTENSWFNRKVLFSQVGVVSQW
jgi:radial spoke head protein 9